MYTKHMKEKLLTIQTKLNAPKNQRNNFGGFNYRSCEDILTAVKPLLAETNTSLTISDEVVLIWETRFYIKATATLYDNETWEAIAQTTALAREQEDKKGMDQSQVTGAASSYARKYALNWLFCIDDNRDADAMSPTVNVDKSFEGIIKAIDSCKTSTELSQIAPVITEVKPTLTADNYSAVKEAYNKKLKELK